MADTSCMDLTEREIQRGGPLCGAYQTPLFLTSCCPMLPATVAITYRTVLGSSLSVARADGRWLLWGAP